MSTRFRIDSIELGTTNGVVRHEFTGPLTVLSGPVGVGKSTLFELVKFCLGGSARIAPVARLHVDRITVEIKAGPHGLTLTRRLTGINNEVTVVSNDLEFAGQFPVSRSKKGDNPTVGDILLRAMGLPVGAKVTSRAKTSTIGFNNIWAYMYAEQREADRSIAHNLDSWGEPMRKATFELLFGLSDSDVLQLKADKGKLAVELDAAELRASTVVQFLEESKTKSREMAAKEVSETEARLADARATLASIRNDAAHSQNNVDVVRELVLKTRDEVAFLMARKEEIEHDQHDRRALQSEFLSRAMQMERSDRASSLLAPIDFVVCPRCVQSISQREVAAGICTLCLQPEPSASPGLARRSADELGRLSAQQQEVAVLIGAGEEELLALQEAIATASSNLQKLGYLLDERTREFISPRLEAFADSSAQIAAGEAKLAEYEQVLRQWDLVSDLTNDATKLKVQINTLIERITSRETALAVNRRSLLQALDQNYRELVGKIGVPTVTSVGIDAASYLPTANGIRFDQLSTGGITTALISAYWVAVLTTALRETQTLYPGFLILDTPRKSIGSANARLVDELYRELDTLANANADRFQVIIADNDIPAQISKIWQDKRFDYDHPTVSTIDHPGEANVTVLNDSAEIQGWQILGA